MTSQDGTTQTFTYDATGKPTRAETSDDALVSVFTYQGDLLATQVDTSPLTQTTAAFQYGAGTASYSLSYSDNSRTPYNVNYTLDARGYPQSIVTVHSGAVPTGWPARYAYHYAGCQMTARVAYLVDGSVSPSSSLQYSYDSVGRLIRITSADGTSETRYDYSCW
jgi:YD repeat-containing protein